MNNDIWNIAILNKTWEIRANILNTNIYKQ